MAKLRIDTDEFLTYTLHYALGTGFWNQGDGHTWIVERASVELAKQMIKNRFAIELNKLFEEAIEEAEDAKVE
jgi:hypothetical protein